ncbi:hypothetical protein EW146_g1392 [Bondarzewia mesenterica]|uniref:Mediator of RNA polymerase II transcription subunit 17 n=1 Tax=Bondarzewia mesenterica TaxID=1095465 RepID=A0A4S4M435_9AGAM|nr:hypothetical protein EW146_g1392 [Bondarzewia mesenterica]
MEQEPSWKKLKLSLEQPYKNDKGLSLPVVLDILPDGEYVYEPNESPGAKLGESLRRVFQERGLDFFEQDEQQRKTMASATGDGEAEGASLQDEKLESLEIKPMSSEELYKMRMEILPQLHIALGEMTLSRDVLSLFLSSTVSVALNADSLPALAPPPGILTSSSISVTPAIPSVQSFNAQLVVGGKDEALRKAADLFRSAADSIERGRHLGERYWMDSLKVRRRNWGLIPAPLPFGAPVRRGSDRTTKDFLISFGLEESSPAFQRKALGQLSSYDTRLGPIIFPQRQRTILRISLSTMDSLGNETSSFNHVRLERDGSLDAILRDAQREVVEQEIFSVLIKDAGNLPTASASVSERLIVLEAAQNVELRFELVDRVVVESSSQISADPINEAKCDLIYSLLHILLLKVHTHNKNRRLSGASMRTTLGPFMSSAAVVLQPVIDLLQYQVFCERIHGEMSHIVTALRNVGVATKFHFNFVGENGEEVVRLLSEGDASRIGGEAIIRIDDSRTLRLTFHSPSSLTAHLSQATLPISSIPQLIQLLKDEMEQCLLQRLCEVGANLSEHLNGTWFVDLLMGRSVGKWEGCALNFRTFYEKTSIHCIASRFHDSEGHAKSYTDKFDASQSIPLFSWVEEVIQRALSGV